MDRWDGFGYVVAATVVLPFIPFIISLFGRGLRFKGAALGFGFATFFLIGYKVLELACWIMAWVFAVLALQMRKRVDGSSET